MDLSVSGGQSWAFMIWDGKYTNIMQLIDWGVILFHSSLSLTLCPNTAFFVESQERKANIWQHSIHELRGMKTKVQSGPIRRSVQRGIGKYGQGVFCWQGQIGEEARGEETQGVDRGTF